MNCQQCNELLVPLIHNLLADEQRQAVIEHIKACPTCLAEFKAVKGLHDRLTGNGRAVAQKSLEDAVWGRIAQQDSERISAALAARASQEESPAERATEALSRRRSIMRSQLSKFAAAAVVVIVGALLGYTFLFGPTTKVTIGDVLKKLNLVKSYSYKMNMEMDGLAQMVGKDKLVIENDVLMAPELGMRVDSYGEGKLVAQTYISMVDANAISVMPEQKKYLVMKFSKELLAQMKTQNHDPRMMVDAFIKCRYEELGDSEIDGVKVAGFKSTDPNIAANMLGDVSARLWIDKKTNLVVRYELNASDVGGKNMSLVLDNFKWDQDIDASEFTAKIPDDYQKMADVSVAVDPETMAKALSYFAELTGRYPKEMNVVSMTRELQRGIMAKYGSMPKPQKTDELQKDVMQKTMNLTMGMTFYGTLAAKGKDPAYHGDVVTPDFPDAVLMRWLGDDGKYIVIFGNCTIGQATADELKAMEDAPLNSKPEAVLPNPSDGQKTIAFDGVVLSWIPGANVTDHKVYLGTDAQTLPLLAEVSMDSNTPTGVLEQNATYYWRVDEVQPDGSIATGDVWSFTTGGLVAHYTFDETSGSVAADSTENPVDGTLAGNPTWTAGHIGGALEFDGDGDYVSCGTKSVAKFEMTDAITVSAWIKTSAFDHPSATIVSKGDRAWSLQRNNDTDTLQFGWRGLMVNMSPSGAVVGKTPVNDGNWHQVVGVYDGNRIALYIDGKVDAEAHQLLGLVLADRLSPVAIGADPLKHDRCWKGLIDDVRIYNCALNADDIQTLALQ